jgi:hypothetical protein
MVDLGPLLGVYGQCDFCGCLADLRARAGSVLGPAGKIHRLCMVCDWSIPVSMLTEQPDDATRTILRVIARATHVVLEEIKK